MFCYANRLDCGELVRAKITPANNKKACHSSPEVKEIKQGYLLLIIVNKKMKLRINKIITDITITFCKLNLIFFS